MLGLIRTLVLAVIMAVNTVGYTSQITAGFRAVELAHNKKPIIVDHLAQHLAGAALHTALADYQQLQQAQGPGRSLRVPARNRIMDDFVLEALQLLQQQQQQQLDGDGVVQVVHIGCGMDTKPWRVQPLLHVHWFEIDQPAVMQLKQQLLQQAGAATATAPEPGGADLGSTTAGSSTASLAQTAAASDGRSCVAPAAADHEQQQHQQGVRFPLLPQRYSAVPADLAMVPLAACLQAAGFQQQRPTVWVAEALLYYLPLDVACELLRSMRALSGAGSCLAATCIDAELQQAHLRLPSQHYFSTSKVAWHFSMDELAAAIGAAGWRMQGQPQTAAQLARERYGRETYVALYGGAECCFTAVPG